MGAPKRGLPARPIICQSTPKKKEETKYSPPYVEKQLVVEQIKKIQSLIEKPEMAKKAALAIEEWLKLSK